MSNVLSAICRVTSALLLSAPLLALPAGCLLPQPRKLTGSGMDMFAPAALRVHPLTRLTQTDGKDQIEARIELTDQMGDVGKGVGTLTLELFAYELALPTHQGARLALWNSDISTPELNRLHWDPITRTYLFRLPAPGLLSPEKKAVLKATMNFPNDTRLRDQLVLNAK